MEFNEFGDRTHKAIILIHGAFVSWHMWAAQIEAFEDDYHVIVPLLDGHDSEKDSTFTTIQRAASDIAEYVGRTHGTDVFGVIGCSLGGVVVAETLAQHKLVIEHAIIDGAYLTTMSPWLCRQSAKMMCFHLHGIQRGNGIYRYAIGKMFSEDAASDIRRVCATMSDETCENAAFANYSYVISEGVAEEGAQVAYWYGEKEKGLLAGSVKHVARLIPSSSIEEFAGLGHGGLVSRNPDVFTSKAKTFFGQAAISQS